MKASYDQFSAPPIAIEVSAQFDKLNQIDIMSCSTIVSSAQAVEDINLLTRFLADSQLSSLSPPIISATAAITINPRILILVGSAILDLPTAVFSFFRTNAHNLSDNDASIEIHPYSSISTLVLTGGIGHSTKYLYDAILSHPIYYQLPSLIGCPDGDLNRLSEARLFYFIFVHFHDGEHIVKSWNNGRGLKVIVEDQSTNCGANAAMSKAMLDHNTILLGNRETGIDEDTREDVIIVQDPTMSLRTKASFEKMYEDQFRRGQVRFWNWPVISPVVRLDEAGEIGWDTAEMHEIDIKGLWTMSRFFGLLLGEIPRLRDDENGYGPRGKGFIAHIDIPSRIESAWKKLNEILDHSR